MSPMLLLAGLLACGPKVPTVDRAVEPAPLAPRAFALPPFEEGRLSNGLRVLVVSNHEVPLVAVTLAFPAGGWTDPADRPGLASVSMDMLNEGAGSYDAAGLSAALRKLASTLDTGAGPDGANISLSTLEKNLAPSLDLMALVLTQPTFPEPEWQVLQKQRLANLRTEREDAGSIARRAFNRVLYGDRYFGNLVSEASYQAMTLGEMRGWITTWLRPEDALMLVGGDTTLAEVQPLLEARFGAWKATGAAPTATPPDASVARRPEKTTIYLVDKPGASQSVLRLGQFMGARTDPDVEAFELANAAVGGNFTARVNMNLRESKGYTYGARSFVASSYAPDLFILSTSVRADATVDAIRESLRELREARADRPITAEELENVRGNQLGTWPLAFETPGGLLGGLAEMWRYKLPTDWLSGYPDRLRAVDLNEANAAWSSRIDPSKLAIVVVGDATTLRTSLAELELPVIELDVDGRPVAN